MSTLAAGVLVAAAAPSAFAEDRPPYEPPIPDDSGWIFYTDSANRAADVHIIQGQSQKDGTCHFRNEATLLPGESTITVSELAFHPGTCRSRLALTTIPADETAPTGEEEFEATPEGADSEFPEADQAATRSSGYLWSWYGDPLGLKVAEVSDSTTWSWDGSSVLSSPAPTGSQATRHFSTSGWRLEDHNWRNVYSPAQTTSSTYAHFRNDLFCVTIDTHAHADRNTVHGQADGDLQGVWSWSKSGGCDSLLSFNHRLERTLN